MIIKSALGDEKVAAQLLAESCGFIPSRFGRAFGYEASTDAIMRLISKVKEQTEEETKELISEVYR
jgi:hypothetical protein